MKLRVLLLALTALLVASTAALGLAGSNYDQSPFGVNYLKWHYFDHPGGIDELRAKMKTMKAAGLYWDRDAFEYGDVHPKPDVWKWNYMDNCVALAREEGINLIGLLLGGPTPTDEAKRKEYGEYVYQVVNRYKNYVKLWEIWNEPNIPSFWPHPDVKLYSLLMKEAYTRAKQADPTCTVIAGSTSGTGQDWFNGIYDYGGWDYCDGISIHPYAMAANPIEQDLDTTLRMVKKCIGKFGRPKPIWSTEVGWQAKSGPQSEEAQATKIVQTYIIHIANGIQNMAYFCMDDYDDWGFVKRDKPLETKLAYGAVGLTTKALGSPGPCAPFEGYLKMPDGVACYVFKKKGDERVLFLWSNDGQTRAVQLPQTMGLTGTDIINRHVTVRDGALTVGPTPVILFGASARKIGRVSLEFNPYLRKTGKNLLVNPSMNAKKGKSPHGWNAGRFFSTDNKGTFATTGEGRGGSTCASISKSTSPAAWDASPLPVDPDKKYTVSAWIKTKEATGRNMVGLYWYSGNMWTYMGAPSTQNVTGTRDWTKVSVTAQPPRGAALVRVNLVSYDNAGTTWFDDVTLVEH